MEKFLLVNYVVECFVSYLDSYHDRLIADCVKYTLSIALAKISIIFFYLRTFGHMRWMQVWCYVSRSAKSA